MSAQDSDQSSSRPEKTNTSTLTSTTTTTKTTKTTTKTTAIKSETTETTHVHESKSISTKITKKSELIGDIAAKLEEIANNFKPGQRKETPPPAAGTRVFYESLYYQNPDSFMALKWCLEYGILPREKCEEELKRFEKWKIERKKNGVFANSPVKFGKKRKINGAQNGNGKGTGNGGNAKSGKSKAKSKKLQKMDLDVSAPDFSEGIGTTNV